MGNEVCLFPGDWIEFRYRNFEKIEKRIGKIIEITAEGNLILEVDYGRYLTITPKEVLNKFPKFCILPIPGKEEGRE